MKRGDIGLVNLDSTAGNEIQKFHPCVIISPPDMHDHLRTVIVAPMTTGSKPAPFRIPISHQGKRGLILLDQIRTVDKTRLAKRLGAVSSKTLGETLNTLQETFSA